MNRTAEAFFRYSGYLTVRNVVDEVTCQALVKRVLQEDYSVNLTSFDSEGRRTRIEAVTESFGLTSQLPDVFFSRVTDLLGPNWTVVLNRHNHITIDYGCGTSSARLHRDSLNWSRSFLTALIPLQMPDRYLSWPRLIPGSQLWPIEAPSNGGGYWLDEDHSRGLREQAVPVRLNAGDVLFIDPLTFHGSGIGERFKPRLVLTLALRSSDELAIAPAQNELITSGTHSYKGQTAWAQIHA